MIDLTSTEIIFVGPLPPPVHGQAVCTKSILEEAIRQKMKLMSFDTSERDSGKFSRIKPHVLALRAIFRGPAKVAYLSVNARWGMVFTLILAAAARLKKMSLVLHHHYYGYVPSASWMVKRLIAVAGKNALHVTNCDAMSLEMRTTYPELNKMIAYSNIGVVSSSLRRRVNSGSHDKVVLGHLSNLTQEKGIGVVIDSFRKLSSIFPNLELHIAGPYHDNFAKEAVANICNDMGHRVVYYGAVYGADKQSFFDGLDIFVYPTKVDTQGIVNLEALACGKPVVATAFCCIPNDIGDTGGHAAAQSQEFSSALNDYIEIYMRDPVSASIGARERFETLVSNHEVERKVLYRALGNNQLER